MPEETSTHDPFEGKIPAEVREHFRTARKEMRAGFQAMLPPEVRQHGRNARKEMLLAWRSLIDKALERLDEKSAED
jgi:hypothetical protein